MKNESVLKYCLLLAVVLFLISFQDLFPQQRTHGEIQLGVTGVGDQDKWYYE
jgi:hypothetical protein